MGVARFPYDGQSFTDVFRNVDIALNFAKKSLKENVCQYDSMLHNELKEKLVMENLI